MSVGYLGDVSETIMGQAPPGSACNKDGTGTIFVKAGEFSDEGPLVREWTTQPQKLAKSGDVLVCVVGATAGKINLGIDCAIGRSVAAVRPNRQKLDTSYLNYFLRTQTDRLRGASQGLAQGVITREMLAKLLLPLPPLDEQRRIAAILGKADALRRKRKRALDLLDGLTQSIFLEIFVGGSRWNVICPLGELSDIVSGITKGRKLNGEKVRSICYLAVANVQDKWLDLSAVKTIDATEAEISRYRLRQDDLLLTEGGDPDKLGRGTLWNNEIDEAIHQNHIFRVRVRSDDLLPLYLMWLVGSAYGKSYFLRSAKQTTGIASINKQQLSSFPVPIPPLRLQKSFADALARVRHFFSDAVKAKTIADTLFASIQSRAFSGQL